MVKEIFPMMHEVSFIELGLDMDDYNKLESIGNFILYNLPESADSLKELGELLLRYSTAKLEEINKKELIK